LGGSRARRERVCSREDAMVSLFGAEGTEILTELPTDCWELVGIALEYPGFVLAKQQVWHRVDEI
jgi:hypothetical protein